MLRINRVMPKPHRMTCDGCNQAMRPELLIEIQAQTLPRAWYLCPYCVSRVVQGMSEVQAGVRQKVVV
jgi:hypothetical protein